jgi:hypothetical protein
MTKWSGQTQKRVALLALGTAAVMGVIWFLVITRLQAGLKNQIDKVESVRRQLEVTQSGIRLAEKYNVELSSNGLALSEYETLMAQGDIYRWVISSLRPLQAQHDVTVLDFTPPQIGEFNLPPKVPYKAATYTIAGLARFHEFGAFLADFENSSPFIRIKSLTLEAVSPGAVTSTQSDKLSFKVEFSTLVKQKPVRR